MNNSLDLQSSSLAVVIFFTFLKIVCLVFILELSKLVQFNKVCLCLISYHRLLLSGSIFGLMFCKAFAFYILYHVNTIYIYIYIYTIYIPTDLNLCYTNTAYNKVHSTFYCQNILTRR